MSITYDFSGDENKLRDLLRCYSVSAVLKNINLESNHLFSDDTGFLGAERRKFKLLDVKTKKNESYETIIQSWNFIDLAYYSVLYSNDYRGKKSLTKNDFILLYTALENYKQVKEENKIKSFDNGGLDIIYHVYGFVGEQFKFQNLSRVYDNLVRDLYVIFESSKKCDSEIDFCSIVEEESGARWEDVCCVLNIAAFAGLFSANTIEELEKKLHFKNDEKRKIFRSVINHYTATYEEIRSSPIERQILYTKPFVCTQNKEILLLGPFLTLMTYEHCILWILRNYFRNQGKNESLFVNMFGIFFEKYFEELLANTLSSDEYNRIPESFTEKRADWRLILGSHKILVEQKSSLLSVIVKQQETNINTYKRYLRKTIFESVEQLKSTEDYYGDGKYIKIVLLYEDYVKPEILDCVMEMPDCPVNNDSFYWLVTIEEMEKLLCLYKQDYALFDSIIKEKIRREINKSKDGKSLDLLMEKNNIRSNSYLAEDKFDYYRNAAIQRVTELCQ